MSAHAFIWKCHAGVPLQNLDRSNTVAFAEPARLWRDLCLRTDRYATRGAAESVTSPGSSEAGRFSGSTSRRQMDALSLGAAWRSARSSRARRLARVDGQRPSDEWRTAAATESLLPSKPIASPPAGRGSG